MNAQPPEDNLHDRIIAAYRRANGFDRSRPSQPVRDAIMERALHLATLRDASAEQSLPTTSAANDSWWRWKTAAGIAAVGLAGLLALQTFRTAPHGTESTNEGANMGNAPGIAGAPSSATPAPSDKAPAHTREAAAPQVRAEARSNPGDRLRPQEQAATAPPTDAAIRNDAARRASPEAPATPATPAMSAVNNRTGRASAATPDPWHDKVIAQARESFPELFNGAALSGIAHIAMVLNSDGTVYKTARVEPPGSGDSNASLQLSKALGLDDGDLKSPAIFIVLDKTSDQKNAIVVAFGVLRNAGSAGGTR